MKIVPIRCTTTRSPEGALLEVRHSSFGLWREALLLAVIFSAVWLLHLPLLRLPYFWDEAGYFIPAARDLLLTGNPIPTSTLSNAHPPLVMSWLVLWWKLFTCEPAVTRTAMLLVSAFTLLGVFRLAWRVGNTQMAAAATILTALYPVFFAQSSLAQLDVAAAALTIWGLEAYLRSRVGRAAIWFALAGLAKETALITPMALASHEFLRALWFRRLIRDTEAHRPNRTGAVEPRVLTANRLSGESHGLLLVWSTPDIENHAAVPVRVVSSPTRDGFAPGLRHSAILLASLLPLMGWLAYHYVQRGFVFGNPDYFRYNVVATINPLRIVLAFAERIWQLFGYLNMFVLTGAAALAWISSRKYLPRRGGGYRSKMRGREPARRFAALQIFAVVIAAYVLMLAVVGGAVLARYLLPAYPLVIIAFLYILWRRVPWWRVAVGVTALAFVAGLFVSPLFYRLAPEDNLTYADFVRLHQQAGERLQALSPARVLTAWPASDELRKPSLGYVSHPVPVLAIEDFTLAHLTGANSSICDYALIFSTKYEPPYQVSTPWWIRLQTRFFHYHRDVPPQVAAELLGGKVIWQARSGREWAAIIALKPETARIGRDRHK